MENPELVPKYISRLRESIDIYLNKRIEEAGAQGLVTSHGNILVHLYANDKQPMCHIAQSIGRCRSTLTVLVDKLEKEGYITRTSHNEDTRIKQLCLTQKGKDFEKDFWEISHDLNVKLWEGFTKEEQETLLKLLEKMSKNMKSETEDSEIK